MRTLSFFLCAAGAFFACHQIAVRVLPSCWKTEKPPRPAGGDWYVSNYGDLGLDHYVLRFGLCGVAERLRQADVLCLGSSKGMYGIDADLLGERLSRPGRPIRIYNLCFGFGEGFHYPMEIVKALDLHDKVLLADLTDNTYDYHLSPMGRLALECNSDIAAAKILWEKWLTYERDRLLNGILPRVVYSPAKGFQTTPHLSTVQNFRRLSSGTLLGIETRQPHWAKATTYPGYPFLYEQLREPFFEECRKRNLRIIFTSIPYEGYDPEWGRKIARDLGYAYVGVADDGIELFDSYHMTPKGRAVFTRRLADRLSADEFGVAAVHPSASNVFGARD